MEPVTESRTRVSRCLPDIPEAHRGLSSTRHEGPSAGILVTMTEERRERWERAADWPLTAAAVLFLVAYAVPILNPGLSVTWRDVCRLGTSVPWALFGVDFLARVALSEHRLAFVARNLPDLVVVALPLLRPLRLLRLVKLLSVLNRYAGRSVRGRVAVYVVGSTSLILFVASLAALEAERGKPGATIKTFGDAIWWAISTVTTVGYGDRYPVTGTGRFVAAGLMLAGIALVGVVTASFASWLLDKVRQVELDAQVATRRDIAALAAEIAELKAEILAQRAESGPESSMTR